MSVWITKAPRRSNGRVNLDGFKPRGNGYERPGVGGRTWRIARAHGGFTVRLEPRPDAIEGPEAIVDDFADELRMAVQVARNWDRQLSK